MPVFRSTNNIFKDFNEHFDENWMDSDSLVLPPCQPWDYKRPIKLEDVDLWEVIVECGQGKVYAAWQPFAEFYLLIYPGPNGLGESGIATFHSHKELIKELDRINCYYVLNDYWIDNDNENEIKSYL